MTKITPALVLLACCGLLTACGGSGHSSSSSNDRGSEAPGNNNGNTGTPGNSDEPGDTTPGDPNDPGETAKAGDGDIQVLSNRADLISGGDALIRISAADPNNLKKVTLDGADGTLVPQDDGSLMGLVSGLKDGVNTLTVTLADGSFLQRDIINHPIGGPVFSGPQIQPWKCTNGSDDAQCNQPPSYSFKYLPADAFSSFTDNMAAIASKFSGPEDLIGMPIDLVKDGFSGQSLEDYDPDNPPADSAIAKTTTDNGETVPFIVRVEDGVINRDRYRIMVLWDQNADTPWTAATPQKQWNHKLYIHHGSNVGVEFGMGNPPTTEFGNAQVVALSRGFMTMSTAQNNLGHNANLVTAAESMMMVKERIIEQYGSLRYSIGSGCSGGGLMQQQVANAYPGIYQGIIVQCAFPDVWTTAVQFADYHLLNEHYDWGLPDGPEDVALMLKDLLADPGIMPMISFYGHLPINPIASDAAFFPGAFPDQDKCRGIDDQSKVYDPENNPQGIRCGLVDWMQNQFGIRTPDVWSPNEELLGKGFTGMPFDNVGVQYGLVALQNGLITGQQFLELNRKIGGLTIDFRTQPERTQADPEALRNAYRTGAINTTENMKDLAMIDLRGLDPGASHDAFHSWQMRARLQEANGDYDNQVIWYGPIPVAGDTIYTVQALLVMDKWLSNVETDDNDDRSLAEKIRTDKPIQARDRCLSVSSLVDEEHIPPLIGPALYPNPIIPGLDPSQLPDTPPELGKIVDTVTNQVCGLSLEGITDLASLLPGGEMVSDVLAKITGPIDALLAPVTNLQNIAVETRFGTPRTMAGEDIRTLNNKCQLKPVDPADYATAPFLSLTDPSGLVKQLVAMFEDGANDPGSIPDQIGGLLPSVITNPESVVDTLTNLFNQGTSDPTNLPIDILEALTTTITPDAKAFAKKVAEVFPDGVCDYRQPPEPADSDKHTIPWLQYGSADDVIYGGKPLDRNKTAEDSRQGWASPTFGLTL